MAGARSLDEYIMRRTRAAGGSLLSSASFDENIAALKQIYLQPIDALCDAMRLQNSGFVSFANYDYVGLGEDPRVRQAAAKAAIELGVGAGASRLVGGSKTVHEMLEHEIAAFLGVEDAVTLVSGYMTNASLIGHMLTKGDLIFIDDLSHNSIVAGASMSRATLIRFDHNDMDHLESLLKRHRAQAKRALIIVEGLYSMDGDVPDLPRLLALRESHDAWLMVDEAHSVGVMGSSGRGIAEHFGIDPNEIDFIIGTLSKSFAGSGGFIAGRSHVMDWLRFTLPAFVFSVGLSPSIAAAVREGISILRAEPWRITALHRNSQFFLQEAKARGLNVGPAVGAGVLSIQFVSHEECMNAAKRLLQAGYFAPPIPQLAVPKNKPRIRFFVSALHTFEQISGALGVVQKNSPRSSAAKPVPARDTPLTALNPS